MSSQALSNPRVAANAVILSGALTLITMLLMLFMAGDNPKPVTYPNVFGFKTAIIWFELAANADEVFLALGDPATAPGRHMRVVMDVMNKFDYGFMVGYALLNASFFLWVRALNRSLSRRLFVGSVGLWLGLICSAAMYLGDVMENVQLLKLTGFAGAADVPDGIITSLNVYTRIKWCALFAACLLLGVGYASYFGRLPGLLLAFIYATTGIVGLFSVTIPGMRGMLEMSSNLIGLCWIISLIHAGVIRKRFRLTA